MVKSNSDSSATALHNFGLSAGSEASKHLFKRAKEVLAGGVNSSSRSALTPQLSYPICVQYGRGSRIIDADENEFVDYLLGFGGAILGHADFGLVQAVTNQLERGTIFGTNVLAEIELAELFCRLVPCTS